MIYCQTHTGIFEKYWESNLMNDFTEICTSNKVDTDEAKDLIKKQLVGLSMLLKAIEKMEEQQK